ncbi:MAG TPA: hypothetical protein PKW03_01000 [Acetivibrio sp.]|nr:hypothetical protein [Acetivibrio sp.]
MFVNHVDKKDIKEEVSSVADIIKKIQKGDLQLKEEFIKDNLTYILSILNCKFNCLTKSYRTLF